MFMMLTHMEWARVGINHRKYGLSAANRPPYQGWGRGEGGGVSRWVCERTRRKEGRKRATEVRG